MLKNKYMSVIIKKCAIFLCDVGKYIILHIESGFNKTEEFLYNFIACHPRCVNAIFNNQTTNLYTTLYYNNKKLHVSAYEKP